jgi:hypothetical protein
VSVLLFFRASYTIPASVKEHPDIGGRANSHNLSHRVLSDGFQDHGDAILDFSIREGTNGFLRIFLAAMRHFSRDPTINDPLYHNFV